MKKGVNCGRIVRNGIIFILVLLMFLGALSLYEEIAKKESQDITSESIEVSSSQEEEPILEAVSSEPTFDQEIPIEQDMSESSTGIVIQGISESAETQEVTDVQKLYDEENTSEPTDIQQEEIHEYIGTICLTFDDGPSLEITNQILDILQEKNVKATFFILDYDDEKLAIINREIADGHTVALHGYSHEYSSIYSSLDAITNNFVTLQDKLYNDTGYFSNIIRFPGGASNTVSRKYCTGIMTEATQSLTDMGFVYFDWNVDSNDAGGAKSAEEIYNNVTSTLVEGRTNVVLMHDSSNKLYTLEALSRIIDYGLEHGFEFQAITEDTKTVQHNVNN